MTFARGAMATLIVLIWINKDAKEVFVGKEQTCWPSLIFRCSQGTITLYNGFILLKYFNVSTITTVCALSPMFICIFAFFILKATIEWTQIRSLMAVFSAVALIITGEKYVKSESTLETPTFMIALLLLA